MAPDTSSDQRSEYAFRSGESWRESMVDPCTCPPRPSDDECPQVEECYQAWLAWRDAQPDGGFVAGEWGMTYDEAAIRQACYDAYFDTFGGDQQDADDIEAADTFCHQVLWRLHQSDGSPGGSDA